MFVILEQFPLTPAGEVDREALPMPGARSAQKDPHYVAPRNPLEHVLSNLWCDVLKLKRVGVTDDFFSLGGHSLLAVRLILEVNKHFKTKLPVPVFFQNRTIERLASVLTGPQASQSGSQLIRLHPGKTNGALIFLNAEIGLCRLASLLKDETASFTTVVSFTEKTCQAAAHKLKHQLPGLEELAEPHTALIKEIPHLDTCILVGYSFSGLMAFEVAHQLQNEGIQVEAIFLIDAWASNVFWWQKFPILTFDRLMKSLHRRAKYAKWRLSVNLKRLAGRRPASSAPVGATGDNQREVTVLDGNIPWELVWTIYMNARQKYRKQPLNNRAVLFRARDISQGTLNFNELCIVHGTLGWGGLYKQGLEIVDCSGDHHTILKQPSLQLLADEFSVKIKKLRAARTN